MELTFFGVYEFKKELGEEVIARLKELVANLHSEKHQLQLEEKETYWKLIVRDFDDNEREVDYSSFYRFVNELGSQINKRGISMTHHGDNFVVFKDEGEKAVDPFLELDAEAFLPQNQDWIAKRCHIIVEFDKAKFPSLYEKLQAVVKKHLPDDEYKYAEGNWLDGEPYLLLNDCWWYMRDLSEVKTMLDELNTYLLPIKEEAKISAGGYWFHEGLCDAATWRWNENRGLEIVASKLL